MLAASLVAAFLCGCAGSHAGGEPQANLVKMTNGLKYAPAEITITAGQTVHWKNVALFGHTVTADASLAKRPADVALPAGAGPFNSGNIGLGKEFSYTFTVPGTYKYFCIPHETSGMTGTVIVNKAP
jgi:plastocyanin